MRYVTVTWTVAALALAGALASAQQTAPAKPKEQPPAPARAARGAYGTLRATATIKGEGITGTAQFMERRQGTASVVEVSVTASGLKPGRHGVHLHAVGKCEPDFNAAGGHFDPGPAGNTDPDANHPYHMGDLPNIEVGQTGRGTLRAMTTRVTLSEGPLSVFDADGTAIVIHGNEDQGKTGEPKSGVSGGPRVACGVISK
jgi:Cu-Zn family superoxide dismutase